MNIDRLKELKKKAEETLKSNQPDEENYAENEFLHNLQVYQAELEIQNEELLETQKDLKDQIHENRMLFEHSPIAYFVLDGSYKIVNLNKRAEEMLVNLSGLIGVSSFIFLYQTSGASSQLIRWLSDRLWSQIELQFSDSPMIWHLLEKKHLSDDAILLSIIDISDQVNYKREVESLANELEISKNQALDASNAKSIFIGTLQKEIETPLSIIKGYSELLLQEDLSDEVKHKLKAVLNSAEALEQVEKYMGDMSHLEPGKIHIEMRDFNLQSLIQSVLYDYDVEIRNNRNIKVLRHFERKDQLFLYTDPMRVSQILGNLLKNALQYSYQGTVTIDFDIVLQIDSKAQEREFVEISVEDTGIGLSEKNIEEIFNKVRTSDPLTRQGNMMHGQGLAQCKNLIRLLEGDLGVESELGNGSRFWFRFPYFQARKNFIGGPNRGSFASLQPSRSLRALVVEHDLVFQNMLCQYLGQMGHVAQAFDVNDKLDADETAFDFLVLDHVMGEKSKLSEESSRLIAQFAFKEGIPVLYCLPAHLKGKSASDFDLLSEAFISRPLDRTEIASAINVVMGELIHPV